ncbi:hypothetical protein BHE90_011130 [Fusarium euwallaceae]|uniref:Uncharacterized protein n=3 Tax=Fusarium solani species complex TaxID=232080 RepID=A0A428SLA6_9HYPO|nr:hypothetical protein CEP51_012534 [Fusarium floridanum]RSL90544.1 hypothetical protein CEP52_014555 [Fusarium oligoseptatum]RTE74437.1 hypothetical protein BHE90_011130 [Fusarium euwallaceae]
MDDHKLRASGRNFQMTVRGQAVAALAGPRLANQPPTSHMRHDRGRIVYQPGRVSHRRLASQRQNKLDNNSPSNYTSNQPAPRQTRRGPLRGIIWILSVSF